MERGGQEKHTVKLFPAILLQTSFSSAFESASVSRKVSCRQTRVVGGGTTKKIYVTINLVTSCGEIDLEK